MDGVAVSHDLDAVIGDFGMRELPSFLRLIFEKDKRFFAGLRLVAFNRLGLSSFFCFFCCSLRFLCSSMSTYNPAKYQQIAQKRLWKRIKFKLNMRIRAQIHSQ